MGFDSRHYKHPKQAMSADPSAPDQQLLPASSDHPPAEEKHTEASAAAASAATAAGGGGGGGRRRIVIIGATGQQGAAVADRLLAAGSWDVCLLVRPESRIRAKRLAHAGATLLTGSMFERASLERAFAAADAVFFITDPTHAKKHGPRSELGQGQAVADAAKKAGVRHVIYSSVACATGCSDAPWAGKQEVERYLASVGVPHTIIQPTFLMENFNHPKLCRPRDGKVRLPLPPGARLQLVSCRDIAMAVQTALEQPDTFMNERVPLAGDELTGLEIAEAIAEAVDCPVEYKRSPPSISHLFATHDGKMFKWIEKVGFNVDMAACEQRFPATGLLKLTDWVRAAGWDANTVGTPERKRKWWVF